MSILTHLTTANRVALSVYRLIAVSLMSYFLIRDATEGKRHGRRR